MSVASALAGCDALLASDAAILASNATSAHSFGRGVSENRHRSTYAASCTTRQSQKSRIAPKFTATRLDSAATRRSAESI